jgi:hypothetical protein
MNKRKRKKNSGAPHYLPRLAHGNVNTKPSQASLSEQGATIACVIIVLVFVTNNLLLLQGYLNRVKRLLKGNAMRLEHVTRNDPPIRVMNSSQVHTGAKLQHSLHYTVTQRTPFLCHHPRTQGLSIRRKNSSLVLAVERMRPSIQLVVVDAPVFCTPRITMQRWLDSTTTATPWGCSISERARATCLVRRSWTWRRRENISAMRASLDRPMTRRFGM